MSSSVLYDRLGDLSEAGLVTKDEDGDYRLTEIGALLGDAIAPLDGWSRLWATEQAHRR